MGNAKNSASAPPFSRRLSRLCIAAGIAIASIAWQPIAHADNPAPAARHQSDYDHALQLAREGHYKQALTTLKALSANNPEHIVYRYDLATVLSWAGRDREALDVAADFDMAQTPAYVLRALGGSARNVQDFALAEHYYRATLKRDASDRIAGAGLALTLTDRGDTAGAYDIASALAAQHPNDLSALSALSYVQLNSRRYFGVLDTSERMLQIDPDSTDARRAQIMATYRLGAPHLAADLADATPGLLTAGERARIENDRQAMAIRWARLPATPQTAPDRKVRIAILDLREEIAALEARGESDTLQTRGRRYDLLVSLHERGRNREAIELYETSIANENRDDIPAHVLATAGNAYLAERQPKKARELFEEALTKEPGDFWTRLSLVYAHIEAEEFKQALSVADELVASEPIWLGSRPDRRPNSSRLIADITAAYVRAYANDLADAERRIDPLAEAAPLNAELRTARATIWLWRGWPRQALAEYDAAIAAIPANQADAIAGRGHALLELDDYRGAEQALQDLKLVSPDSSTTRQLTRDLELGRMNVLRLQAQRMESSGSQQGNESLGFDGWLHGELMSYHYRPFLHYHFQRAKFPEGTALYRRAGVGIEYRARDVLLDAEINRNVSTADAKVGIAANARWTPSDHWSFSAGADSQSNDVPLRGRFNEGIDGWSTNLGVDWRAHELRSAHAGVGVSRFSDGNRRDFAQLQGTQRIFTRPHYRMDGVLGAYASRNSRNDAAVSYFNPRSDYSADFTLDNEWLQYRHYSHTFRHHLALTAGNYYQQNFGSDMTWALHYEQRWSPHDRFDLGYGLMRARRVYDGAAEYQTTLLADLTWRF
ncbi:MAG: poly-beta-1,6 N-acetyl-D-glucosamine export porin PgaA [Chromatiales bacterium]|nr:poly-beta-1,6 N-acetyl-D-glucosamine export porin PgaA [Chromatiales bacterium]